MSPVVEVGLVLGSVLIALAVGYLTWLAFGPPALRTMSGTMDDVTRRVRTLERQRAIDHALIIQLREQQASDARYIVLLLDGIEQLIQQLDLAKILPVWRPPERPESLGRVSIVDLHAGIRDWFSVGEIDDLAFRLGFDPEELDGESKTARCRSLVTMAEDHDKLGELIAILQKERSFVDWSSGKG
jgi:hypothetical protein